MSNAPNSGYARTFGCMDTQWGQSFVFALVPSGGYNEVHLALDGPSGDKLFGLPQLLPLIYLSTAG